MKLSDFTPVGRLRGEPVYSEKEVKQYAAAVAKEVYDRGLGKFHFKDEFRDKIIEEALKLQIN